MKHYARPLAAVLCLLAAACVVRAREGDAAPARWESVQSRNFLLVGDAEGRDMLRIAARLEQFRAALLRVLPSHHFDSSVPLTVVVFKDDASYNQFEPIFHGRPAGVSGFFQSGADVDYIALSLDRRYARDMDELAFHEYVHLLVRNGHGAVPLWFNEGLAEYYSTVEISGGGGRVTLGRPVGFRVKTLKDRELMPLETLLGVDDESPFYKEQAKRALFYSQSWAFVHYLLGGPRRAQLPAFLELLAQGAKTEDAFRQAFQADFAAVEDELRAYVRSGKYRRQEIAFDRPVEADRQARARTLTEAEEQFYLGDLLLHTNRLEEAAGHLEKAAALDPRLAVARAALAVLRVRQNDFEGAVKLLDREDAAGVEGGYLVHYYRAYALSRQGSASETFVETFYGDQTARRMRAELEKVIGLNPSFAEAYRLLAWVNLVRDERLDESLNHIRRALELSPRRREYALLLAQIHLRREAFGDVRRILEPLARGGAGCSPVVRGQARSLLAAATAREQYLERVKELDKQIAEAAAREEAPPPGASVQPCDAPQPGAQLKKLRFSGQQACGLLVRFECDERGILLVIETDGRTLRLRNESLSGIRFVTYTAEVRGQMTCGERTPESPVLVTYRPPKRADAQSDGEAVAVEFMPKEWNANH
ncbi:MAG TPA: DUF1570 domain-containing protein [Pyrinomonadaceae bacterium]|nr:DUF1570 domain-containing protein [Pyrinomonadaceae bacterium]